MGPLSALKLGGEDSNLVQGLQRTLCCRLHHPRPSRPYRGATANLPPAMGSLIKKRRKRMRKKKHKKLLKRTRWQRRAAGK